MFVAVCSEILRKGKILRFRANGWSMYPFIRDGEIIYIKPVRREHIRLGDVILYKTYVTRDSAAVAERLTAHRVVRINRKYREISFIARGDSSFDLDEPVSTEQVLGRVVRVERQGKIIDLDTFLVKVINFLTALKSRAIYYVHQNLNPEIRI